MAVGCGWVKRESEASPIPGRNKDKDCLCVSHSQTNSIIVCRHRGLITETGFYPVLVVSKISGHLVSDLGDMNFSPLRYQTIDRSSFSPQTQNVS